MFTDSFKRQHDEILVVANDIAQNLQVDLIKANPEKISNLLLRLNAKINTHLMMEDKVLYPKLYCHSNSKVRNTAKEFFEQMGGLSVVFKSYCGKWSNSEAINRLPSEFIKDTKEIFAALSERIEKENNELYPIANKVLYM